MLLTFVHDSATKLVAPKAVTVKVDGLHSVDKRDALIKALLGVKGVTSVTVDQRKGVAIMYVTGLNGEKMDIPRLCRPMFLRLGWVGKGGPSAH